MLISDVTYAKINDLLTLTFQMNSFTDNIAYYFGAKKMLNTEDIFHHKFAHAFPALADELSELMLKLDARPTRGALIADEKMYDNLIAVFDDLSQKVLDYRRQIIAVIDQADYNGDYEIKIALEEYLNKFLIYINQVNVWLEKANEYADNIKSFDHDFDKFTVI